MRLYTTRPEVELATSTQLQRERDHNGAFRIHLCYPRRLGDTWARTPHTDRRARIVAFLCCGCDTVT